MPIVLPHDDPNYKFIQRSPHSVAHRLAERKVHPATRVRTYKTACGQVLISTQHECYLLKDLDGNKECAYCIAGRPSPGSRGRPRLT